MPVAVSYPGVYVEEIPSGVRTITGVATSITAFLGRAVRGDVNDAVVITSFGDFERKFGGLAADYPMSYAVRDFFQNGGSKAVIVRLFNPEPGENVQGAAKLSVGAVTLRAASPGTWGNKLRMKVELITDAAAKAAAGLDAADALFNLEIKDTNPGGATERILNLAIPANKENDVARRPDKLLEEVSSLVRWDGKWPDAINARPDAGNVVSGSTKAGADDSVIATAKKGIAEVRNGLSSEVKKTYAKAQSDLDDKLRILWQAEADFSQKEALAKQAKDKLTDKEKELADKQKALDDATAAHEPQSEIDKAKDARDAAQADKEKANNAKIAADAAAKTANDAIKPAKDDATAADDNKKTVNELLYDAEDVFAKAQNKLQEDEAAMGGVDSGRLTQSDYEGKDDSENKTGIHALAKTDLFNLLSIPPDTQNGTTLPAVYQYAMQFCADHRAMLLVDSPAAWSANRDAATDKAIDGLNDLGLNGTAARNAALYFPRVRETDPLRGGRVETFVPSGIIAGVMARTDSQRGVWKAPAGIDAALGGIVGLDVTLNDQENGRLNPLGINVLRTFPIYGSIAWGSRTMRGADQAADEWKYVPVRRTALYIEESLFRGLKWVVFEPNDEPLWAQIRLNVGAFMHNMFRQGAFQGINKKDAYFVKCDAESTTQNDINLGIVNIVVGFAPLKPAEFVIIKLQQMAGQIKV